MNSRVFALICLLAPMAALDYERVVLCSQLIGCTGRVHSFRPFSLVSIDHWWEFPQRRH